ncbi:MAG: TonB-dependent receptor [Rhodanobacteraceae bacterium]|nr:TonB-dependent receptor [Rhodanobacteraceae bacterium]
MSSEFALELGTRYSQSRQQQRGADADDADSAFTAGAVYTPSESSRWTLNLSSGYRFATLEERYFTGVTAQGDIVGNPNLSSETSLGVDLGYAWHAGNWGAEVHAWQTDVDDLISLFAIAPGVNGYANVSDAKLHGASRRSARERSLGFNVVWSAQYRGLPRVAGNPPRGFRCLTAVLSPNMP